MAEQINALFVHAHDETFHDLARVLRSLNIEVHHARNCREASLLFKGRAEVDMIFSGVALPDGNWADVLQLAQQARRFLPVIVVSRMTDVELYLDALEKGAFDVVTPPFLASDVAHIIRSAIFKELVSAKQNLTAPPAA